jgi:cytochrome c oxidase cbb3-type subunit III
MNTVKPILLLSQASEPSFWSDPFNHPLLPVYAVAGLVGIVLILVLVVSGILLRAINIIIEETERRRAKELGIPYMPRETWWRKMTQRLNASVPVEKEKSIELDHNYDGIRELDNHLPPWWKWLFYGTVVWSVVYLIVYHISASLPLSADEYQNEIAKAEEQIRLYRAQQPQAQIDVESLQYNHDPEIISKGKEVFTNNNCGSCHRQDGGGNTIGPNLTDEYWIHGGDVKKIFTTVKDGVVEKGMPAWGRALSPTEVRDVVFFVMSLQGTNPANAKAPQGELFRQSIIQDSTKVTASILK